MMLGELIIISMVIGSTGSAYYAGSALMGSILFDNCLNITDAWEWSFLKHAICGQVIMIPIVLVLYFIFTHLDLVIW